MPCQDYTDHEELSMTSNRLNEVSSMLCVVMELMEKDKVTYHYSVPKEIKAWWEDHKARDRERIKQALMERQRRKEDRKKQYNKLKKEFEKA